MILLILGLSLINTSAGWLSWYLSFTGTAIFWVMTVLGALSCVAMVWSSHVVNHLIRTKQDEALEEIVTKTLANQKNPLLDAWYIISSFVVFGLLFVSGQQVLAWIWIATRCVHRVLLQHHFEKCEEIKFGVL